MKLRPLEDRVLVKRRAPKSKSTGGIVIPDAAAENSVRCFRGTVLAVGPGRIYNEGKLVPVAIEEGDEIVFGKFHGVQVTKTADEDLIMLREDDISGKIVEEHS